MTKPTIPHRLPQIAVLLLLTLALFSSTTALASGDTQTTSVHFSPPSGDLLMKDEIEIEIWVSQVTDLYGLDIQLTFDPNRIEIIDADPSQDGVQIIPRNDLLSPDIVLKKEADNVNGTVWYAVTQLNPTPPASGSGAVFAFKMRPLALGPSHIDFSNIQLVAHDGSTISYTAIPVTYNITNAPSEGAKVFLPFMTW